MDKQVNENLCFTKQHASYMNTTAYFDYMNICHVERTSVLKSVYKFTTLEVHASPKFCVCVKLHTEMGTVMFCDRGTQLSGLLMCLCGPPIVYLL
jgi:hypothetical protein